MPLPETAVPGALQTALVSRGIRLTRQRRIILEIIETAKQHLDAAQILRKAARLESRYQSRHRVPDSGIA